MHVRVALAEPSDDMAAAGSATDPGTVEPPMRSPARTGRSPLVDLTARERAVLSRIAQGMSNAAIAESLVLTKRAVEKHINSIFLKLGLSDDDDISKRVKATLMFLADATPSHEGRGPLR